MGDVSTQETRETLEGGDLAKLCIFETEGLRILEANRGKLSSLLHDISEWKKEHPLGKGEVASYRCVGKDGNPEYLTVTSVGVPALGDEGEQLTIRSGPIGSDMVAFYWTGKPDVPWRSGHDNFCGLVSVGGGEFNARKPEEGVDIYGFRGTSFTKTDLFDRDFPLYGKSYWKGTHLESHGRSFVHGGGGDPVQRGREIFDVLKSATKLEGMKS